MADVLSAVGVAALNVLNPAAGRGPSETLVGLLLIGAFIAALFVPHSDSMEPVLIALASSVVAFYFGRKSVEYTPPGE